ncbi:hypothetical protein HHL25_08990 [Rhizobium sp. S-51]|uniref:Uncharacterized protein n=1 Tax=Rhizobium terricola TaxID=2728849 RepID=A0A7Y0AVI8_9HYPH|nr:hypothetical protein [Rhizobium terricola]NML74254.1 hypothetical protein [Rhizobium terricola]
MTSFPSVSNYAGIFDTLRLIGSDPEAGPRRVADPVSRENSGQQWTIDLPGTRPESWTAWSDALEDELPIEEDHLSYEGLEPEVGEASIRLKALLASQQLGIQSLSIANADARAILRLFQ